MMKNSLLLAGILCLAASPVLFAQEDTTHSATPPKEEKEVKKGWAFGAFQA